MKLQAACFERSSSEQTLGLKGTMTGDAKWSNLKDLPGKNKQLPQPQQ